MAQTPQQRRQAQRRLAKQLKEGERPLGGEYQKRVVSSLRARAHRHVRDLLSHLSRYDDAHVRRNIYQEMDMDAVIWTISADAEEIRSRAGSKEYLQGLTRPDHNPWWYHGE